MSVFSSSDELKIAIKLKSTDNDLFDIANDSTILSVVNNLSDITNDYVLMSLGNTKLTIIGLKDTTVYIIQGKQLIEIYLNSKSYASSYMF